MISIMRKYLRYKRERIQGHNLACNWVWASFELILMDTFDNGLKGDAIVL